MSEPDRPDDVPIADFDHVYDEHFSYVWRTLGRLGVPPSDLADAAHEVFIVVYRRWADLDGERVRAWLFGIARRIASQHRRKRVDVPVEDLEPSSGTENDELAAQQELLWRGLAQLDDERRAVIVLHDIEGRTGVEIARMLELPPNTVHSRLRLAREDLVAAIERLRARERRSR